MDQLASIGCEFLDDSLDKIHSRNVEYYEKLQPVRKSGLLGRLVRCIRYAVSKSRARERPWALKPIFDGNKPIRPWALHSTVAVDNLLYSITGKKAREPGLYKKMNPETGRATNQFLVDTNERVHPSVRVRLACEGLGPNDSGLWHCPSLLKNWRPRLVNIDVYDPISAEAAWGPSDVRGRDQFDEAIIAMEMRPKQANEAPNNVDPSVEHDHTTKPLRWVWEYAGDGAHAPYVTTMIEEKMGPFERQLLKLAQGRVSIHDYAKKKDTFEFKAFRRSATKGNDPESQGLLERQSSEASES